MTASRPLRRVQAVIALLLLALSLGLADAPRPCIVVYETDNSAEASGGNSDIRAQKITPNGTLPWGQGLGVAVAATPQHESRPLAVPDGAGGAVVIFELRHESEQLPPNVDIHAQRLSPEGVLLWNAGEPSAIVATGAFEHDAAVVADGQGGAIVAFLEDPRDANAGPYTRVCVERIDDNGAIRWGEEKAGLVIHEGEGRCESLAIASDGRGGAFVAFHQSPAGSAAAAMPRIRLHRVTDTGQLAWAGEHPGGLALGKPLWNARNPHLVSDDDGGVWAVFEAGLSREPVIVAQRIGPDGKPRLSSDHVALAGGDETSAGLSGSPALAPDGKGGLICAVGTQSPGAPKRLHALRVGDDGAFVWGHLVRRDLLRAPLATWAEYTVAPGPDHAVTVAFTVPLPRPATQGHGGLAAVRRNNVGWSLWGNAPVEVTNPAEGAISAPGLLPDGEGGVYVTYVLRFKTGKWRGDTSIFALRLDSLGKRVWPQPLPIAATPMPERAPVLVPGQPDEDG